LTEWRFDGKSASERVIGARQRVARGAVSRDAQVATAFDLLEILFIYSPRKRVTDQPHR
jgi:hypothetical protein